MKVLLGFLAAISLLPMQARARLRAEAIHSVVEVFEDGTLRVTDTARFRVRGSERLSLRLPANRADAFEIETTTPEAEIDTSRRRPRARWWIEAPGGDSLVTVSLTYTAQGAIAVTEKSMELRWRVFTRERGYDIRHATATVLVPDRDRAHAAVRNARLEATPAGWTLDAGHLTDEETAVVRITFTPDVLAVLAPDWQERDARWRRRAPLVAALAAGLLLLGVGLVVSIRRDLAASGAPVTQLRVTSPPSDLSAVLAGAMCDGKAGSRHAVACLLELAEHGVVGFEVAGRQWGTRVLMLRRLEVPRDFAPWERIVLQAAFRKEESPGLTRVEHAFAGIRAAVQPFDVAVRAHLQRTREIASQREKQGRPLFLVAGIAAAVAFPSFALVPLQWSGLGPAAFAIPAALALVALAALVAGATLPRTGMREHPRVAAWRGFAQHLKLTAKDPAGLDTAHFQAWLPYAVAFDLQPAWLQAAKRLHLQPPAWFHGKPDDPADVAALAALFGRLTETSPPTHTAA